MKSPRRGSGICLEGWGGDPGGRVLGRQSPLITVGLAEANLSTCKTRHKERINEGFKQVVALIALKDK